MKQITTLLMAALLSTATLASGNFSMIEINPLQGTQLYYYTDSAKQIYGAGEMSSFVEMNGLLYFVAQSTPGNDELWVTDGTQQGTQLVKEINPFKGASISKLYKVGNRILFAANDDTLDMWTVPNFDLFSSDGTAQGTVKVADLNEQYNDFLSPSRVSALSNNRFIFCTSTQLMVTDGSTSGTQALAAIQQYSQGFGYCEMNGKVYFMLYENGEGKVWSTNGTVMGTQEMINLTTSSAAIQYPNDMKAFNGKIYIVGAVQGQGSDLFVYDGAMNGNVQRIDLTQGSQGNSYPTGLNVYANRLWFVASNMSHTNLYSMNSSDVLPEVVPSTAYCDVYSSLNYTNGKVYFQEQNMKGIHWVNTGDLSDGIINLPDGFSLGYAYGLNGDGSFLVGKGGNIFFSAYDSVNNSQVFMESNGTTAGTQIVMPQGSNTQHPFNFQLSCGIIDVFDFTVFGDNIVVPANFNNHGRELWLYKTDMPSAVIEKEVKQSLRLYPNPARTELTIETSSQCGYCECGVEIFDLQGQKLMSQPVQNSKAIFTINQLPAGEYLAVLQVNGEVKNTAPFVVSK